MKVKSLNGYQKGKLKNNYMKKDKGRANRGKEFEQFVEQTNELYKLRGRALIEKTEPPVKVTQVTGNKITLGWYQKQGFVDYFGVSHGRAIAFEAKNTKETKRFDLKYVEKHQLDALHMWKEQGGIAFILVHFENHHETYILRCSQYLEWYEAALAGGRKSIPYEYFVTECEKVGPNKGIPLDYLSCL